MQLFTDTVSQLIILFAFIASGILLGRLHILSEDAAGMLAKLETYLFIPALTLQTTATQCKIENINQYLLLFAISAVSVVCLFFLARLLAKKFARKEQELGIYTYAFTVGNYGYMGYPMMQAMFGDHMLAIMMIAAIPINFYVYSLGMGMMTDGKISFKSLINPSFITIFLGMLLGFCNIRLPLLVDRFLSDAGNCMSPVAMLISGLVIGQLPFGKLFSDVRIYFASLLRLVLLPLAVTAVLLLLRAPMEIVAVMLVMNAMPAGMNTIVFPESYGIDASVGAKLVMVSNILCIVTIPALMLLFTRFFPMG